MSETSPALDVARLQKALLKQMDAFFSLEPAVLDGSDPESIHDMRVASRRLQEILNVVLPGAKTTRRLFRDIRHARRLQAAVRDLDVMIEHLQKLRENTEEKAQGDGLDLLVSDLASRRKKAHARLCKNLPKAGLSALRKRLTRSVKRVLKPDLDTGAIVSRVHAITDGREQAFLAASAHARETMQPQDLHAARVAGKRIRYILEVAEMLQIGSHKDRIHELKAVQQGLGDWHDLEVLEDVLIRFCSGRKRIRVHTGALRALYDLILQGREEKTRLLQGVFLQPDEKRPN